MNRYYTMMFAAALTGACALQAQAADPLSTEARQGYTRIKNNMLKMTVMLITLPVSNVVLS